MTEIYDYLRLLFARVGRPYCPNCDIPITSQTVEQMVDRILEFPEGTRLQVLAPVVRGRKGEHQKLFDDMRKNGYVRVRVDGELRELTEPITLEKNRKHTIEVVVDRIVVRPDIARRLADSLETALALSGGLVVIDVIDRRNCCSVRISPARTVASSVDELAPRMFSFNSPFGACETCYGLGVNMEVDEDLVIPDPTADHRGWRRLCLGRIDLQPTTRSYWKRRARRSASRPTYQLRNAGRRGCELFLHGNGENIRFTFENDFGQTKTANIPFEGVIPNLERRYRETDVRLHPRIHRVSS